MILHYLKFATRHLAQHGLSTLVSVVGLSLGFACFVGAFMVSHYVNGAESHFANADRTLIMYQQTDMPAMDLSLPMNADTSPLLAERLVEEFPEIEAVSRSRVDGEATVTVQGRRSFRNVRYIDPAFLKIFDLPFIQGSAKSAAALSSSAILTESTAKELFGRTDVLGERLEIAGFGDVEVTGVIGAIPEPSQFSRSLLTGKGLELFVVSHSDATFDTSPDLPFDGGAYEWLGLFSTVNTYVLLPASGTLTIDALNARLPDFTARNVVDTEGTVKFEARPIASVAGDDLDTMLWSAFDISVTDLLLLLGGLVLATACLNFVNLATARSTSRAKEAGLRKTLGARRGHLMLQHMAEGVVVAALAVAVALVVLQFATGVLNRAYGMQVDPPWSADPAFWLFVLVLTVLVGVASAAYPAFGFASVAPSAALRAGSVNSGPRWLRTLLIGLQFTAASFLLIFVIVVAAQNSQLRHMASEMRSDTLVVIETQLQDVGVDSDTFHDRLLQSPYVEAVTGASVPPWELTVGGTGYSVTPDDDASYRFTQSQNVTYDYFSTLGIDVLAGRVFARERNDEVDESSTTRNIVIDRLAAAQFGWSPADAVGKVIYSTTLEGENFPLTIIGVVEHRPPRVFGWMSRAFVYSLTPEIDFPIVRISSDHVEAALADIDRVWAELAPDAPSARVMADERFRRASSLFRSVSTGFATLASFAFAIAVTGLFGMAYFIAARRRHEMGVRKVLGASSKRVFVLLLADFLRPVLVANLLAWPLAYLAARQYVGIFIEPIRLTPVPFLVSLAITVLIAGGVVAYQAARSSRIKPARVLRHE